MGAWMDRRQALLYSLLGLFLLVCLMSGLVLRIFLIIIISLFPYYYKKLKSFFPAYADVIDDFGKYNVNIMFAVLIIEMVEVGFMNKDFIINYISLFDYAMIFVVFALGSFSTLALLALYPKRDYIQVGRIEYFITRAFQTGSLIIFLGLIIMLFAPNSIFYNMTEAYLNDNVCVPKDWYFYGFTDKGTSFIYSNNSVEFNQALDGNISEFVLLNLSSCDGDKCNYNVYNPLPVQNSSIFSNSESMPH